MVEITQNKIDQALEKYRMCNRLSHTGFSSDQYHTVRLEGMREILSILGIIQEE